MPWSVYEEALYESLNDEQRELVGGYGAERGFGVEYDEEPNSGWQYKI